MSLENLVPWRRNAPVFSSPLASNPFSSVSSLQREMNRMFNSLWTSPSLIRERENLPEDITAMFTPQLEMTETDGHIEVSAELPGVSEKDIDVSISADGQTLSIRGEKKISKETKNRDIYYAERSYGSFHRTMLMPAPVDPDKVTAKFHNGVLDLTLTKINDPTKNMKRIAIKST